MSQSCACSLLLTKTNEKDACSKVPQSSSLLQSCAKEKSSGVEIGICSNSFWKFAVCNYFKFAATLFNLQQLYFINLQQLFNLQHVLFSLYCKHKSLNRVSYFLVFVILENEFFMSVSRHPLFFWTPPPPPSCTMIYLQLNPACKSNSRM